MRLPRLTIFRLVVALLGVAIFLGGIVIMSACTATGKSAEGSRLERIPIHWGTFDLALHSWVEPAERLMSAAKQASVQLAIPRPGQSIDPASPPTLRRWWGKVPWQQAREAPVISTGLDGELESKIRALSL